MKEKSGWNEFHLEGGILSGQCVQPLEHFHTVGNALWEEQGSSALSAVDWVAKRKMRREKYSEENYSTTTHNTVQRLTTQYNDSQHNTTTHNTVQRLTTQYNDSQHSTTTHNTVQ